MPAKMFILGIYAYRLYVRWGKIGESASIGQVKGFMPKCLGLQKIMS